MKGTLLVMSAFAMLCACVSMAEEVKITETWPVQPEVRGEERVFPKAVYSIHPEQCVKKEFYISNHDQQTMKEVAFLVENQKNVVYDFQGSEMRCNGRFLPMLLTNAENITIKNLVIDHATPHIRQLNVLAVNKEGKYFDAEFLTNAPFKIEGRNFAFSGPGYDNHRPNHAMGFSENHHLTYVRRDIGFNPQKIEKLDGNKVRIYGWQDQETSVGERFALRSYFRPNPAIVVSDCKNIKFENVKIHYAEGMGLLCQMTENITLDKFGVCLRADGGRYFTTQADATHFSGCKGKLTSINGLYEGMADDAINVHGTYLRVTKRIDASTVRGRYMHGQAYGFNWGFAGDDVQFIQSKTMELLDNTWKIKSIKSVDKPTALGAKEFEITFDRPIPEAIKENANFGIENLTWTPEVYFANNIVRNNRARGALFSTPKKVICENNLFDHTHGTGILLCGDCNGWYETGACRDVVIRNNVFKNALTACYQFTNAVISIYPEIPNLKDQKKFFHSNIVIENNTFEMFDKPILYAKSVDGLTFQNNKIIHNNDFKPYHFQKVGFKFEHVQNVLFKGNQFPESYNLTQEIKTTFSAENAVKIEK